MTIRTPEEIFQIIRGDLTPTLFTLSFDRSSSYYFPEYLKNCLDQWVAAYQISLREKIDSNVIIGGNGSQTTIMKITRLASAIYETVNHYYEGRVLDAGSCFDSMMDELFYLNIKLTRSIEPNMNFYRARKGEDRVFNKLDLFHIAFEKRHLVSTNRYSIPGFPALYLGDSTYVCWEEYDRYRLRDLYFSRLVNQSYLNVLDIQLFSDFMETIEKKDADQKLDNIIRYIITFPLIISCTRRVLEQKGSFKPEYIIPQLLLQYISKRAGRVDGIKFPSSKVNYENVKGFSAYM